MRTLHLILGDQLARDAAPLDALDPACDGLLMMEVAEESEHVPSHVQRTVLFLSAMRHFAAELREGEVPLRYVELDDPDNTGSFEGELRRAVEALHPERLSVLRPGSWRVLRILEGSAEALGLPLIVHEDERFLTTPEDFAQWAQGRKRLTMEHFYRPQRRRLDILMEEDGKHPVGGKWNLDHDNRESFSEPPDPPRPWRPRPDAITRAVIRAVRETLPSLPGRLHIEDADGGGDQDERNDGVGNDHANAAAPWPHRDAFRWPVTPAEAERALEDFIAHRLPRFGTYEDAMWEGERHLYHALLSSSLNLGLLSPMACVDAAVRAWQADEAPLNAVEGFVRQIIGWREFIRGIYWLQGEDYGERNALGHDGALPSFFWSGETEMACVADALDSALGEAYNHHIPRLMVLGNLLLLAGVHPREVGDWYLGIYVDATDQFSAPNALGMSQHADGGVVGTKPYVASARYIEKMGHFCGGCSFDQDARSDPGAVDDSAGPCPFNVLFWDFLLRHQQTFGDNPRMTMMLRNAARIDEDEAEDIRGSARRVLRQMGVTPSDA